MGLDQKSTKPASLVRATSSGSTEALSATIGISSPRARRFRHTSIPLRLGGWMRSRMRSNRSAGARASPAGPSRSTTTSWSSSSAASKSSTFIGSSSTMRMRKFFPRLARGLTDRRRIESLEPCLETEPVDRLGEVVVGSERQRRVGLGLHRDDDHRHARTWIALLEVSEELLAAAVRKSHVEYHADRAIAPERVLRLGYAAYHFRAQVARSGNGDDQVGIVTLVFDDKDPLAGDGLGVDVRQHDAEGRAVTLLALEGDPAAHFLDEPLGQRETKPGPSGVYLSLMEPLEDPEDAVVRVARDADAGVSDTDEQIGAGRPRRQRHRPSGRGELHGVRQQVEEDLADARLIDEEALSVWRVDLELHTLGLRGPSGPSADRFQEDVERHHFVAQVELAGFDL